MGVYNIPAPGAVQGIGPIMAGVSLTIIAVGIVFLVRYRKTPKRLKVPVGALLTGIILLVTSFVLFFSARGVDHRNKAGERLCVRGVHWQRNIPR